MSVVNQFYVVVGTATFGYGLLLDQENRPFPNQTVTANLANPSLANITFPNTATTDQNGRVLIRIDGVADGNTMLTIQNVRPNPNLPLISNTCIVSVVGAPIGTGVTSLTLTLNP